MKISMPVKVTLAVFTGIFLGIGFIFLLLYLLLDPNPITTYKTTQNYKNTLSGKWSNYTNKEMNLSFDYPATWKINLGQYTNCADNKAVWINNTYARAHIIICKTPHIQTPVSLPQSIPAIPHYSDGYVVKKIKTPFTTFYSRNLTKNSNLSITDYAVSADKNIVLNVQIPYTSDDGPFVPDARDKVFLKILNSIKDYK